MPIPIATLQDELRDVVLPGGRIVIESHESFITDEALRSAPDPDGIAHPAWFIIASLRCMGITVDQLCELAHQEEGDTLLFGNCRVDQFHALRTGHSYVAAARIGDVDSRRTRDGSRLDSIEVVVQLHAEEPGPDEVDVSPSGVAIGEIASTYLFKREVAE